LFSRIEARLLKLETANRFTAPVVPALGSTPTITGLASGDPSNPRVGDIWLNTTSNTPKYVDSTGAVTALGGGSSLYYSIATSSYLPNFLSSTAAQSMLGSPTFGLVVSAGTTLEYDFQTATRFQVVGTVTGTTGSYQIQADTVSGTPTVSFTQEVDYGSNTTGYAAGMTLSSINSTSSAAVLYSPSTTTASRFAILKARGIIRVTGTGSVKIYPSLSPSQLMVDDGVNLSTWSIANTLFKITPIGNGTVTSVGAWS